MTKDDRLKALLKIGYFPEELPPPFTTADFAKYRRAIGAAWTKVPNYPKYPKTTPERFYIPKVTDWRRELAIVNPVAQYHVAKLVADNWIEIKKHITSCSFGVEDVEIKSDVNRAVPIPDFRLVALRHSEISAMHDHALVADISRFYGTLYTHVIPWALNTKGWSKKHLQTPIYEKSLGSQLDRAVRKGQDNQTIGIPVGPDTSRIIAEIVAVSIDTRLQKDLTLLSDSIVRNVDDWYIGFDHAGEAEEAIAVLGGAARDYELEIHPDKTKVINASTEAQPVWPTALRQSGISTEFSDQSKTIDHFFAQAFHYATKYERDNVLRFAVNLVINANVFKANWHQFETYLLKACRANATTLPVAAHILTRYNRNGFPVKKERIAKLVKDIIAKSGPTAAHFEIAWTLFLAKVLRIRLSADSVRPVTKLESSVCALLLLDLRQMGLIDGTVDVSLWTQAMTRQGLDSNMWLVAYEADLKGWLSPPQAGFVQQHPYFAEIRRRNVSFYNEKGGAPGRVELGKPKKPSDAFLRHVAALRSKEAEEIGAQVEYEEWEIPRQNVYGDYQPDF